MAFNFKIILVGDGGVGKSSFVKKHRTGEFEKKYIATQGVDVSCLTFNTNYGIVVFKVWDCAGQEKFGGLRDGYYLGADGAIVMFDLSDIHTYNNVNQWITDVRKKCCINPVVCGNKCDLSGKYFFTGIDFKQLGVGYYEISAKSNYNFEKPFLDLARRLMDRENLEFIEMPSNNLPVVSNNLPVVSNNLPVVTPKKKVCQITIPGGYMRVTYEFFKDGEVIEQEGF